jgi:hypothetical protein
MLHQDESLTTDKWTALGEVGVDANGPPRGVMPSGNPLMLRPFRSYIQMGSA